MPENFTMPKGRQTIRKSGGRRTRLWELAGVEKPHRSRLEEVYLAGLDAMDRTEARHAANKADTRFTPDGVRDDQVTETRRLLREMNDKADRAIDAQVAASTPMTPKK